MQSPQRPTNAESPDYSNIEPVLLNLGPQHPSTHGVFRIRALLDGERGRRR